MFILPHWSGLTAIMTPIAFVIAARTVTHQVHTSARHYSPSLCYSCVLLFYDHAITIFMTLATHILSYLSLTLPSLNLDSHSFDYSFLSHLCSFLFHLPHFLVITSFYLQYFIFGVTLCHGHSSIYSVVVVR